MRPKLTKPQGKALACLYRRAVRRVALIESVWLTDPLVSMELSAGCGAQPDGEPYDLLRWDRMEALQAKGLLSVQNYYTTSCNVQLTTLGCQVARERMEKNA